MTEPHGRVGRHEITSTSPAHASERRKWILSRPGPAEASSVIGGTGGRVLVAIDRKRTTREIRVIVNWPQELAAKVK